MLYSKLYEVIYILWIYLYVLSLRKTSTPSHLEFQLEILFIFSHIPKSLIKA